MAIVVKDRVKVTTTTTGTSDFTLGSASLGFQDFSIIGDGNDTYYAAVDSITGDWEVGYGTYTTAGPTLTRTTVLESSNGGSKVSFSAGSKDLFVTYPAERSVYLDAAGSYPVQNTFDTLVAATATLTAGTVSTTPAVGTDIANKTYVDTVAAAGIHYHAPCFVESPNTAGNLNALYNQPGGAGVGVGATLTNNGTKAALVIDGVLMTTTKRVLVYNQTNAAENGVYTVTTVGTPDPGGTNWVLTRATDADTYAPSSPTSLGQGDAFFVTNGDTGAGEGYVCTTVGTITFGTTAITFSQFSASVAYNAGTGLNLSPATTFNISNVGTAGTYGSTSNVPVFTTNAQGQVTSVTDTGITIAAGAVSGLAASATTDTTNAANITSGTLPSGRISGSYTGLTGTGALAAGSLASGFTAVSAPLGGTGQTSYAVGDLLYASTTTALSKLADVAVGNALISGGVGSAPSYGKIGLATHVSGTLPVANGGTGVTSSTGTGSVVLSDSPTLVTPALGTPSSGTLTNCTFPTLNQNTTGSAATLTTGRTIAITGDLAYTSPSFNGSANVTAAGTLATVNANVGSFTNASVTVNAKGLVTAASSGTAPVTSVTGTSPVVSSGGATPAISLAASYGDTQNPYASKTANFVLAAPTGVAGVPTFRAVVAADIPTLNQNTTGSAATLTTGRTIAITGDLTYTSGSFNGSANVTGTGTLANSGVVAGTYTKLTVDAKGRATSGTTLTAADIPELTMAKLPGAAYKESVRCATTANITLSAPQTIDGIAAIAGDRVLVKNQTTASQNGIYVVAAGAWARSADANLSSEIGAAIVNVDSGTANGGELWTTTFKTTDTLGTTAMNWFEVIYNSGTWAISVSGNAATVTTNANLTGAITSVGNATSLGSFTSAQLAGALTNETGSGSAVFATSPTLVTPVIGAATGTSLVATAGVTGSVVTASNGLMVNSNTVSASYSIPSGSSAMSAGPMSVSGGVTVTVPTGSRWVVL